MLFFQSCSKNDGFESVYGNDDDDDDDVTKDAF